MPEPNLGPIYAASTAAGCLLLFEITRFLFICWYQRKARTELIVLCLALLYSGVVLAYVATPLNGPQPPAYLYFQGVYYFLSNMGIAWFVTKKLTLVLMRAKGIWRRKEIMYAFNTVLVGLIVADFVMRMHFVPLDREISWQIWIGRTNTTCAVIHLLIALASFSFIYERMLLFFIATLPQCGF